MGDSAVALLNQVLGRKHGTLFIICQHFWSIDMIRYLVEENKWNIFILHRGKMIFIGGVIRYCDQYTIYTGIHHVEKTGFFSFYIIICFTNDYLVIISVRRLNNAAQYG